jgi:hypothetical protein
MDAQLVPVCERDPVIGVLPFVIRTSMDHRVAHPPQRRLRITG